MKDHKLIYRVAELLKEDCQCFEKLFAKALPAETPVLREMIKQRVVVLRLLGDLYKRSKPGYDPRYDRGMKEALKFLKPSDPKAKPWL